MAVADRIALLDEGRVEQVGTPREIYTRPASRFAASFMGNTNLIEATVRDPGPPCILDTEVGTLTASRPLEGIRAGDAVLCSVRPESWLGGSTAPTARGKVLSAVFLGERAEYVVEVGQGRTLVVTELGPRAGGRQEGESLELGPDPGDVVVLPAEDGR
jgi:iron(III) transport system ATP-binding protein